MNNIRHDVGFRHLLQFNTIRKQVVALAVRSDGFVFLVTTGAEGLRIWAGCKHNKTFAEYRRHVRNYALYNGRRRGNAKAKETLAILAALEATAKAKWSS